MRQTRLFLLEPLSKLLPSRNIKQIVTLSDFPLKVDSDHSFFFCTHYFRVVVILHFSQRMEKCFVCRRVSNEEGVCVQNSLWSPCLCVVSDVKWVVLKGRIAWLMICYFSLFVVCVSFSFTHRSTSSSSSSDKTVKIWLSKVWRKRWGSKTVDPLSADLWPTPFEWQHVATQPQFPRQSRCGLCSRNK